MIAIHNFIPFYVMHACTGGCAPRRVYVPYSYLLYSNILVFYSTHLTIQTHIISSTQVISVFVHDNITIPFGYK